MNNETVKYSTCCGVADTAISMDGPDFSDIGICPRCRDHCEFEEESTVSDNTISLCWEPENLCIDGHIWFYASDGSLGPPPDGLPCACGQEIYRATEERHD